MNRRAYYRNMQALALEVRKRHGLTRADISIKQMWKVYRAEGIERIDFWPNLKHILVDKDLMLTLCGPAYNAPIADDRKAIEIGAEVFAAEFIYPEADFVR